MSQEWRFRCALIVTAGIVATFAKTTGCWHPSICAMVGLVAWVFVGMLFGVD